MQVTTASLLAGTGGKRGYSRASATIAREQQREVGSEKR